MKYNIETNSRLLIETLLYENFKKNVMTTSNDKKKDR